MFVRLYVCKSVPTHTSNSRDAIVSLELLFGAIYQRKVYALLLNFGLSTTTLYENIQNLYCELKKISIKSQGFVPNLQ